MAKETALEILRSKLDEFQRQAAITADPPLQFQLQKQIREVEEQIAKLAGGPRPGTELPAVVPQGLKSFDGDAKGFFLQLLPGPYHENGLPQSLHFWKRQIEQTDADETFRVGVIYGQSGCGKSSWIKAGLLPRLEGVTAVYVEAIPDGTPQRLLAAVRKRCPWLGDAESVAEALQRKDRIPAHTKVLIVLDQFEQWLHGRTEDDYAELLDALQVCDGSRVHCLLLIRSDFWDLLTRFLRKLDVRQEEGKNLAMFDLFDKRHASHVLALFGRAFGAFSKTGELSSSQEAFLRTAVDELSDNTGRIVSVRLSLLAEMLKRREWTPATLHHIGGTSGVGFAFLEENFSSKEAPKQYKRHETAARAVLEYLLPSAGTDIKGAMRSEEELLSRSGYAQRADEFNELLQILNSELRLITPTTPVDAKTNAAVTARDSQDVAPVGAKYYQLTHDYLVPSLRNWITAKHKATRQGRAQLRLVERSAAWNAKPENRNLPAWWEYLNILWFTRARDWTQSQCRMMRGAGWRHGMRGLILVTVLALAGGGAYELNGRYQAQAIVEAIVVASPDEIRPQVERLKPYRRWADPQLDERLASETDTQKQLNVRLALVPIRADQIEPLQGELLQARDPRYLDVIRESLLPFAPQLVPALWDKFHDGQVEKAQRFRAGVALARYATSDPAWTEADAQLLVTELLPANPEHQPRLRELLRLIRERLLPAAEGAFTNAAASETEQLAAANLIADYCKEDLPRLARLTTSASLGQLAILYPLLETAKNEPVNAILQSITREQPTDDMDEAARITLGQRRATAELTLLRLGEREPTFDALRVKNDPESLTQFVHRARQWSVPPQTLLDCFDRVEASRQKLQGDKRRIEDRVLFSLLLSLGEYSLTELPTDRQAALVEQLARWYRNDPSSAIHGATGWLLRHYGQDDAARQVDETPMKYAPGREWFTTKIDVRTPENLEAPKKPLSFYLTFVVFAPGDYEIGSPLGETDRNKDEIRHMFRLTRPVAILDHEITRAEYETGMTALRGIEEFSPTPAHAMVGPNWYDSVRFCRWLTEHAAMSEDDQPYAHPATLDNSQYPADPNPAAEGAPFDWPLRPERPGFRLPLEEEWELACRGGTVTRYSFGSDATRLSAYGWFVENSGKVVHVPRKQRPNVRGLFDFHGNASEWCHDYVGEGSFRASRGGGWFSNAGNCRSAFRGGDVPSNRHSGLGFRVALSLSGQESSSVLAEPK